MSGGKLSSATDGWRKATVYDTGAQKSVARVPHLGQKISINGRTVDEYFCVWLMRQAVEP
jgi:hypothetical protein